MGLTKSRKSVSGKVSLDELLRRALQAQVGQAEPSPDLWERIYQAVQGSPALVARHKVVLDRGPAGTRNGCI